MSFLNLIKDNLNRTKTLNNANALVSTQSSLVDMFGVVGALRNRGDFEIENVFSKAFAENKLLAMKMLFYARDIREGLGERRVPLIIYKYLGNLYPDVLRKNLNLLSHFGRWDDLLALLDTKGKDDVINIIKNQLGEDIDSESPSLLAKWLPSNNTSSKETREKAKIIQKELGLTSEQYRQTLSKLRKKIDVVEVKMSSNDWENIDFEKVTSIAMNNYRNAFLKNDEQRFSQYIEEVKSGDKKINVATLYPYNIVEKMLYSKIDESFDVLEQQWNYMPDFINDNDASVLVMADVSGSMQGRPMATAIGLAIYFAERTKGAFSKHFITFSESPTLINIVGETLYEKVRMVQNSNWGMNTNFEKALKLILDTAVKNKVNQSELPKTLIVVSDMQFDQSMQNTNPDWTFYKQMKNMYSKNSYKIPEIVFWNVNNLSNAFQCHSNYEGVKLASGQSTSVFKAILKSKTLTPYDFMLEVIESERYDCVSA